MSNVPETEGDDRATMKMRVARSIKWNIIDKVLTQLLYAVTGIILARLLTEAEFGVVGVILIFQAFATLFVDSGFAYALLQRRAPTHLDYSTVFWFNLSVATAIYIVLFFAAPFIADIFGSDESIVALSRVMFLTFILNASAIVQTNQLIKRMEVKMIAVSNSVGLIAAAVVGIWLALAGYGAWALVWQAIALAAVKSAVLWATSGWRPLARFSTKALRSFFSVGSGVMATSFLNVAYQNIYGVFIAGRVGMVSMGYYYQADKWSKMGVSSLAQVLTSSFLPALSEYQDSPRDFAALTAKVNRFTAYMVFPALGMLAVVSQPLFHILFGDKWDPSVALFQLLLFRGVFTILVGLYNNYLLALGRSRMLVYTEALRDIVALAAIAVTLPYIAITTPDDPTLGVYIFLWGQVAASVAAWIATLFIASRIGWSRWWNYLVDLLPYAAVTLAALAAMIAVAPLFENPWAALLVELVVGLAVYLGLNSVLNSRIQRDALGYLLKRKS